MLFHFWYYGISSGDKKVSIAHARVEPGVSTKIHHLNRVQEIYLITQGKGKVQIDDIEPSEVTVGDIVIIPPGALQKITNTGNCDLIFYCICTHAFTENCYHTDEP
jgi:mannose-6-phosphate isomerase-like protein (cupin superfamily)